MWLNLISPWFWVLSRNHRTIKLEKSDFYQLQSPQFISQINTFQGEARQKGWGKWGKLTMNKATWLFRDALTQYLESFDFHYLFIEGDLDLKKSTRSTGPIYLSLLPFIVYGFYLNFKKNHYFVSLGILASPVLGIFLEQHYETLSRLPFIIGLAFMAAVGIVSLSCKKGYRSLKVTFIAIFILEFLRFAHYYFLHYPILLQVK